MPCVCLLWGGGVSCPVSVYCEGVGCHVLCLFTVRGWGVMSCVCLLWGGGVSCPVSVYCEGVGCHVCVSVYCEGVGCHVLCLFTVRGWGVMFVCLFTVRGWGVMPCVCLLWGGGVSCPVSVYCEGMGCHVLCLFTVRGWGVMSCVCLLWGDGVSCPVSVYCEGVGCHVLCLFTVRGWGVMSCVCLLWGGGVSCPVSVYCEGVGCHVCVSVYCEGVGCHVLCLFTVRGWGVMSCVCLLWGDGVSCPVSVHCEEVGCHVLCLRHGIPVWQHIGPPSPYDLRCIKPTLNPNKQTNKDLLVFVSMNTAGSVHFLIMDSFGQAFHRLRNFLLFFTIAKSIKCPWWRLCKRCNFCTVNQTTCTCSSSVCCKRKKCWLQNSNISIGSTRLSKINCQRECTTIQSILMI